MQLRTNFIGRGKKYSYFMDRRIWTTKILNIFVVLTHADVQGVIAGVLHAENAKTYAHQNDV